MSGPPIRPRSRELEIVRVLFDKHLLERAVNLAEARWAGSGEMVRLAYHWRDLSAVERREQLERVGPEQLSRFRALGDLEPELAEVLNTLEIRGVLPAASIDGDEVPEDAEQALRDTPTEDVAGSVEPPPPAVEPASVAAETLADPVPEDTGESPISPPEDPVVVRDEQTHEQLQDVHLPIDLDTLEASDIAPGVLAAAQREMQDAQEIARIEQERRAEAVRSGEELLRRVRSRLDSTARRVSSSPIGSGPANAPLPARITHGVASQPGAATVTIAEEQDAFTPPPEYWLERLEQERVVVVDSGTQPPTDDQLVGLANEFGLELCEFVLSAGSARELFGGLKRNGAKVDVRIGPLPRALSRPSLVVLRGRLFPRQEARLRQGMCDIPGTRATVPLDAQARVIIIS